MIKELRHSIRQLSENEAKSMLLQTMIQLKQVQESAGDTGQMVEHLASWSKEMDSLLQRAKMVERPFKTVHLVCGESAAGSLRFAFGHEHKAIGFPDFFAVGPIEKLHTEAGCKHRYEWLKDHLNFPDDFIEEEYEHRVANTLKEIAAIPVHTPFVIWTAENADEQTGIRYLVNLLKEKPNEMYLINTTTAYQDLFNNDEYQYLYSHTGGPHPEELVQIYKEKSSTLLNLEERRKLEDEWQSLAETKEVLRIWKDGAITPVNEDYFDELIITAAKRLHRKQPAKDFIKSARIIGEVYGHIDSQVSDAFLEDRLRALIYNGVFEIKGIPKSMRNYSVKLK